MVLLLSWNLSASLAGLALSGDWLCEPGRSLAMPDLSPEQSLTLWKHFPSLPLSAGLTLLLLSCLAVVFCVSRSKFPRMCGLC